MPNTPVQTVHGKSVDIEYYIEQSFVLSLREIFKNMDLDFPYDDDDVLTQVLISSNFPEGEVPLKLPNIIVEGISYEFSETSLNNNYLDDIMEAGVVVGWRYATYILFSATITCIAEKDGAAKNLANKVLNYIKFDAREIFSDACAMDIKSARKSPGGYRRNLPQNSFSHSVSLSGVLPWIGEIRPINPIILGKISVTIKASLPT